MHAPVHYTVRIADPASHRFCVRMTVPGSRGVTRVTLPSWAPGSYLLREFARQVVAVTCRQGTVRKVAKGTWEVFHDGAFTVEYELNAQELSVRTPYLDSEFGFFVGTNLLAFVEGQQDRPAHVTFELPDGWSAYSSRFDAFEGRAFDAADYDELADCAVLMAPEGVAVMHHFDACDTPHGFLFVGRGEMDVERVLAETVSCVEASAELFGEGELPYERYLFVQIFTESYRGGLEHCDSSVLAYPRTRYRAEEDHRDFMLLVAHEFFHVWNVKRVHSDVLGPFDYGKENYTRDLWVGEGWTSYYQNLIALKAGVVDADGFLELIGKRIAAHERKPGRHVESLETSSFDAWIKLYRPDGDSPNRTISYYLKGSLVACLLDLEIRRRTGGKKCLLDVFRYLWTEFGKRGVGYPEGTMQSQVEAVVDSDFTGFFDAYVRGTDPLPWNDALATVGLRRRDVLPKEPVAWIGAHPRSDSGGGCGLKTVFSDGPARAAGLMADDVVIAVERYRVVNPSTLEDILRTRDAGDTVEIAYFRGGELRSTSLTLAPARPEKVVLESLPTASGEARAALSDWLFGALPTVSE